MMILIIVGALIYSLPRMFVPVAKEPLPLNLQRCIDTEFALAIQEVAQRGGKGPCIEYEVSIFDNAGVCAGLLRQIPAGPNTQDSLVTYSNSLHYGQGSSLRFLRDIGRDISLISETKIQNRCSSEYSETRNFNVEFTSTQTILRFDLMKNRESGFERFEVRMDVPLREMRRVMDNELRKSSRSFNQHFMEVWGLNHRFADTIIDPRFNLAHAYLSSVAEGNHLFYIETTNNPLPLPDNRNVRFGIVIEDRYPVINHPSDIACDGNTYVNIIDPDEGQRTNNLQYTFNPDICSPGVYTELELLAAGTTHTMNIIPVVS